MKRQSPFSLWGRVRGGNNHRAGGRGKGINENPKGDEEDMTEKVLSGIQVWEGKCTWCAVCSSLHSSRAFV